MKKGDLVLGKSVEAFREAIRNGEGRSIADDGSWLGTSSIRRQEQLAGKVFRVHRVGVGTNIRIGDMNGVDFEFSINPLRLTKL